VRQSQIGSNVDYEIACVSCPTLFDSIYEEYFAKPVDSTNQAKFSLKLFEYDKRFLDAYTDKYFEFYDYNQPLNVDDSNRNKYNLMIVDPPYLSEECLGKILETVKYMAVSNTTFKLILCTGQIMTDFIRSHFDLNLCEFEPKHERNLANQFRCFTNYQPITFI
jgi:hypothetical protein